MAIPPWSLDWKKFPASKILLGISGERKLNGNHQEAGIWLFFLLYYPLLGNIETRPTTVFEHNCG
jgi:hypothetical protein